MMRTTQTAIASLLLVMLVVTTAIAQNTQETPDDPCITQKDGCVQTFYDKFQDKTLVRITPVGIYRNPRGFGWLSLSAVYLSPGTKIVRPEFVIFYFEFTAVMSDERNPFEDSQGVYLLIDGTPHSLGDVSLRKFDNTSLRKWSYGLVVPFRIMDLIASAKSVEMRAGAVEVAFDDNLKAAFHRLVELTPKEVVAPKKEDVAPLEKPPAQKRTPRRRRERP